MKNTTLCLFALLFLFIVGCEKGSGEEFIDTSAEDYAALVQSLPGFFQGRVVFDDYDNGYYGEEIREYLFEVTAIDADNFKLIDQNGFGFDFQVEESTIGAGLDIINPTNINGYEGLNIEKGLSTSKFGFTESNKEINYARIIYGESDTSDASISLTAGKNYDIISLINTDVECLKGSYYSITPDCNGQQATLTLYDGNYGTLFNPDCNDICPEGQVADFLWSLDKGELFFNYLSTHICGDKQPTPNADPVAFSCSATQVTFNGKTWIRQ